VSLTIDLEEGLPAEKRGEYYATTAEMYIPSGRSTHDPAFAATEYAELDQRVHYHNA
jgi:hypothetical protein